MSDGFDKEAEREKLREKFARDDEKREHTQRMSELLLQGATMTNRHCDDCGDPIFRHDGREFCPTCQAGGQGDAESAARTAAEMDGSASPEGASDESAATSRPDAAEPTPDISASAPADPPSVAADATERPTDATAPVTDATDATAPATDAERRSHANGSAESERDDDERRVTSEPADLASVTDARDSLTETLVRFARNAEETDDPRRARDHLQAAREAAEALAALD